MRLIFKGTKDASEFFSILIHLSSRTDTQLWTVRAPFSGSQKIQSIIVVVIFLEATLPHCWDTASCLYTRIPEPIVPNDCKYLVPKKKIHCVEVILGRVQPRLTSPWQCYHMATHSPSRAEQKRSTASLLCISTQRPPKATKSIQICLLLGSPSSCKVFHEVVCAASITWFCRQNSLGLDLWFPHAVCHHEAAATTANILGHLL